MAKKPVLDLTGVEYDSLRQQLRALIPVLTPYWKEYSDSDPGIVVLDLVAALGDMFVFYLDRRTNEMFLTRATNKNSVIDLGKLFDYTLKRIIAPRVNVSLSLKTDPLTGSTVDLPDNFFVLQGTSFATSEGTTYVVRDTSSSKLTGQGPFVVTAYEGTYKTETFTGTGEDIQKFPLALPNVAANFLKVLVRHTEGMESTERMWTEDTFSPDLSASLNEAVVPSFEKYLVETDDQGHAWLVFNSFRYLTPEMGDTIEVSYVSTDGPAGDIKAGTISSFAGNFSAYAPIRPDKVFDVANLDDSYGGAVEEDFNQVSKKVPAYLSTLWRCVSLHDYQSMVLNYPNVSVLSAKALKTDLPVDSSHPTVLNGHAVQVYVITSDPNYPPTELTGIKSFLDQFSVIGVQVAVNYATPVICDIGVDIQIQDRAKKSDVQAEVVTALKALLERGSKGIGEALTLDEVYGAINAIEDVNWFRVRKMHRRLNPGDIEPLAPDHITVSDSEFVTYDSLASDSAVFDLNLSGGSL
jgi:hypothetical protein